MRSHAMKLGLTMVALSLLAIPLAIRAEDMAAGPWAGTWKFNLAKSTFPGPPPQIDQVAIQPDGTVTVNETNSEGKSSTWTYKPEAGKAVPVVGRGENVTVIATKVNGHRNEQVWNFNGRSAKSYAILSKDEKTQTFHMDGTDKDGKPFHETVVYEKSEP